MSYSQQPLLALLAEGAVPGESTTPEHIETVISNVYLFPKRVYKVYKHDNAYMNEHLRDLGSREGRFAFTREDFEWNRALAPRIYRTLLPARAGGGVVEEVAEGDAEDVLMVMERVDTSHVVFERLAAGTLTHKNCHSIGAQFGAATNAVQHTLRDVDTYQNMVERLGDMPGWLASVEEGIPAEEARRVLAFFTNELEQNRTHLEYTCHEQVVVDGDFHSHNLLFAGGTLTFMDTYPPKPAWKLGHQLVAPYRVAVDLWALSGKRAYFDAFFDGYATTRPAVAFDERLHPLLLAYVLAIQTPYHYHLARNDPRKHGAAQQFHTLLRDIHTGR